TVPTCPQSHPQARAKQKCHHYGPGNDNRLSIPCRKISLIATIATAVITCDAHALGMTVSDLVIAAHAGTTICIGACFRTQRRSSEVSTFPCIKIWRDYATIVATNDSFRKLRFSCRKRGEYPF